MMYNVNFKVVEFDHFKMQAGLPGFVLSVSDIDLCDTIQQFNESTIQGFNARELEDYS